MAAARMRIRVNLSGKITPLEGGDVAVPEIEAEVDEPGLDYLLRITVIVVHGRPVCDGLSAERRPGGPPVTTRGLRALPVDRLVRAIAAQGAVSVTRGDGWVSHDMLSEDASAALQSALAPQRGRRRDPEAKDKLLGQVVASYRDLVHRQGVMHPAKAIGAELTISVWYVYQLVAEARRRGMLGPAIPGRAGEADWTVGEPQPQPDTMRSP